MKEVVLLFVGMCLHLAQTCPLMCQCGYHDDAHTMDCGSQDLADVPSDIPEWTTSMDLDGNELTTLDLNFCDICVYFEEFSIRFNKIEVIEVIRKNATVSSGAKAKTFCRGSSRLFPRLWSLNLRGNRIRYIPKCLLLVLPALKFLNLNENEITGMRDLNFIGYLAQTNSLEELNLRGNAISELAKEDLYSPALALRRLRSLDLSNNRIYSIESGVFTFFDDLTEIDLSGNRLGFLPDFAFVTKGMGLETIKLNDNYLDWISVRTFAGLPKLRTLELNRNELACILPEFWSSCQFFYSVYNSDLVLPRPAFMNPQTRHFHRRFEINFQSLSRVEASSNSWYCDCKLAKLFSDSFANLVITSYKSFNCSEPLQQRGKLIPHALEDMKCFSQN